MNEAIPPEPWHPYDSFTFLPLYNACYRTVHCTTFRCCCQLIWGHYQRDTHKWLFIFKTPDHKLTVRHGQAWLRFQSRQGRTVARSVLEFTSMCPGERTWKQSACFIVTYCCLLDVSTYLSHHQGELMQEKTCLKTLVCIANRMRS